MSIYLSFLIDLFIYILFYLNIFYSFFILLLNIGAFLNIIYLFKFLFFILFNYH